MSATPILAAPHEHLNQFSLLGQRRFGPFFWVQFLGAGYDNVFKFALTVLVIHPLQVAWLPPTMAGRVIGALFHPAFCAVLGQQRPPAATSGQLADKHEKAKLIRFTKDFETVVMLFAAAGFMLQNVPMLLARIFLMACKAHSSAR